METSTSQVEPATISEELQLATWDRPRSDAELRTFRLGREAIVSI